MSLEVILSPFSNFFQSVGAFFAGVFEAIFGTFTLITVAFPPVYVSLFMFGLLALFMGVCIRLL